MVILTLLPSQPLPQSIITLLICFLNASDFLLCLCCLHYSDHLLACFHPSLSTAARDIPFKCISNCLLLMAGDVAQWHKSLNYKPKVFSSIPNTQK